MRSSRDIVGRSFWCAALLSLLSGLAAPLGAQLVWEPLADECGTVQSVLCPSEPWENGCVWAPGVLHDQEDGLYRMWYIDCNAIAIGHAWSDDGIEWEKDPANPVIANGIHPNVLIEAGDRAVLLEEEAAAAGRVFKMWYGWGGGMLYAESLDGSQWVLQGSQVLSTGLVGAWDDNWLLFSRVFFDERSDSYHMWYGGSADPGIWRTGHATSADGIQWVKDPVDRPVIDSESLWDSRWVFPNNVVFDETRGTNGLFEMLYSGQNGIDPWNHLHYATSPDGVAWTKSPFNPVRGLGDLPGGGLGYPALMFDKGTSLYRLWFDDLTACIHYATSPRTAGDPPVRAVTLPGDPTACPPESSGTIEVTISQALGGASAAQAVTVREKVVGPVEAADVQAGQGGQVQVLPQTAVAPLGMFQDSRLVLTKPDCTGEAGEWYARHDPGEDTYTLGNVGEDIWSAGDTFTFVYNRVEGNFVLTAHIAGRRFVPGSRWGKHGIMARQDLSGRSRYSWMHDQGADPQDATRWASRPTHGGADNYETVVLAPAEHHDWLRIERAGDVFTGYSSPDGTDGSWVLNGSQIWTRAPDTVLVGLAVTSHTTDCCQEPTEIVFDEVDLEPGTGALVPPLGSLDPVGVEITWSTTRGTLASGLGYNVLLPEGQVTLEGTAGDTPVFGDETALSRPPPAEHGPIDGTSLQHAHMVGADCPEALAESCGPGCILMAGPGADIWQAGDQFLFAYEEITGDFSASATITERQFPVDSRWGKHGIMVREDCGERSRYSFIHDNAEDLQDSTRFSYRRTHGGADNVEVFGPIPYESTHFDRLRLDRCGSIFIAYVGDDQGLLGSPGEWVEVGRHDWGPGAPASVHLGLAVNSHTACSPATVRFEDWDVLPFCDGPVQDLVCTPNASGGLDLTWGLLPGAPTGPPIVIEVNDVPLLSGPLPGDSTGTTLDETLLPAGQVIRIEVVNSSGIPATCSHPPEVNPRGFIKNWLILGPFQRPGGPAPGEDFIALDFLTDGVTTELSMLPVAGLAIQPDYGNLASSTGLAPTPALPDANPGGVPTWLAHEDDDDTIDFAEVYRTETNNVMCYAAAYLNVTEDATLDIGLGSDDSVQILIDGVQVWINNIPRDPGAPNEVQDTVMGVSLSVGCHLIVVKVFEGIGFHGFRLRFQDPLTGEPALAGRIGLAGCEDPLPAFRRGDADSNGAVNITDAVRILNVLFLGLGTIPCDDAADSDDNGAVNITDAVRVLNVLFLGIGVIPAPGMETCGPDPTEDPLTTCAYESC